MSHLSGRSIPNRRDTPNARKALRIAVGIMLLVGTVGLVFVLGSRPSGEPARTDLASQSVAGANSVFAVGSTSGGVDTVDLDSLMRQLMPSGEHVRLLWDAREVLVGRCMSQRGIEWISRPNNDSTPAWDQWHSWYDPLAAADPSVPIALLGEEDKTGSTMGGCQLEAYVTLHRDGVPAEARAADLYNEAAAEVLKVSSNDPNEMAREISATLTKWMAANSVEIDEVQSDIAAEFATAMEVLGRA